MIVDSQTLGAGEEAAEIAAVLTERGLGGDSVDLDARLDQFRRDRSQPAGSARSLAQRWASQVAASAGKPGEDSSPSTGVMLAFAFPGSRRAQPGQWQFCACQRARRRGGSGLGAGAHALYRGGRIDGHRGAVGASCWRRRSRRPRSKRASPITSRPRTRFRSIAARWRCARGAGRRCTRSRCRRRRWRCSPRPRPRGCWPMG